MGLKEKQGIARIHIHEEHEVCVQQPVDPVNGNGQQEQKQQAPGQTPHLRLNIPARREHDGISGQQDVHREAVEMHEIAERQLGPGGEQQGRRRRRDAYGVETIVQHLSRPEGMDGNQDDVDAAQVQRQVGRLIVAADAQHDHLEQLIPHQQAGEHMTDPGAFPGVLPPVIQTASHGEQDKKRQPRQRQGRVHCKALTGRNGIDRVEKILKHSHHPLSEYLEVPGTVYDSRPVQM